MGLIVRHKTDDFNLDYACKNDRGGWLEVIQKAEVIIAETILAESARACRKNPR